MCTISFLITYLARSSSTFQGKLFLSCQFHYYIFKTQAQLLLQFMYIYVFPNLSLPKFHTILKESYGPPCINDNSTYFYWIQICSLLETYNKYKFPHIHHLLQHKYKNHSIIILTLCSHGFGIFVYEFVAKHMNNTIHSKLFIFVNVTWRLKNKIVSKTRTKMIWTAFFFCMTVSIQLSNGSKNCFNNVTKKLAKNEISMKYSRAFSRGSGKQKHIFSIYLFLLENHIIVLLQVITVFFQKNITQVYNYMYLFQYLLTKPKLHSHQLLCALDK